MKLVAQCCYKIDPGRLCNLVDCSIAVFEKILDFVAHPLLSYLEVRFTHILNQVIDCLVQMVDFATLEFPDRLDPAQDVIPYRLRFVSSGIKN
jgi:hypothetical protein